MTNDFRRDISQSTVDEKVASLLAAAAAPAEPGPLPGEPEALTAFRAHSRKPTRRARMLLSVTPLKAAAASALGAGLLLTGGVAAAATGSLPGAAQDTASELLAKVGVTVPGADDAAASNADGHGDSDDARTAGDDGESADDSGKGEEVSDLARNTESTGVDKGAEVSGLASDGTSRAGQNGSSDAGTHGDDAGGSAPDGPSVETPDNDGTATADDAPSGGSDGASTDGTVKADVADEADEAGHSADGSENRP